MSVNFYENKFMVPNKRLLFIQKGNKEQMNKFVYEIHIFGVYKHKNFLKSVNVYENKFVVPNKRLLFIWKGNKERINNFG